MKKHLKLYKNEATNTKDQQELPQSEREQMLHNKITALPGYLTVDYLAFCLVVAAAT